MTPLLSGLHNRFGVERSALCTSDIRLSYNYGENLQHHLTLSSARTLKHMDAPQAYTSATVVGRLWASQSGVKVCRLKVYFHHI